MNPKIVFASDYQIDKKKSDLILELCIKTNTTHYVTGPGSLEYIKKKDFEEKKIKIEFLRPVNIIYNQPFPKNIFISNLSIIDYLFNCGYENFPKLDK